MSEVARHLSRPSHLLRNDGVERRGAQHLRPLRRRADVHGDAALSCNSPPLQICFNTSSRAGVHGRRDRFVAAGVTTWMGAAIATAPLRRQCSVRMPRFLSCVAACSGCQRSSCGHRDIMDGIAIRSRARLRRGFCLPRLSLPPFRSLARKTRPDTSAAAVDGVVAAPAASIVASASVSVLLVARSGTMWLQPNECQPQRR